MAGAVAATARLPCATSATRSSGGWPRSFLPWSFPEPELQPWCLSDCCSSRLSPYSSQLPPAQPLSNICPGKWRGCQRHSQAAALDSLLSGLGMASLLPAPLPFSFLLTWSLSAKPFKFLPVCTAPQGLAESHSPQNRICVRPQNLPSSHLRRCPALNSCQLLSSGKQPLVQTSPFIWDGWVPLQPRWNRPAEQSGHQAQLKCPLVFRAHRYSRPPVPQDTNPLGSTY